MPPATLSNRDVPVERYGDQPPGDKNVVVLGLLLGRTAKI